jgi:hypothetical protein
MATSEERQHILNMIAEQQITVEQGTQLLTALPDSDDLAMYEDDAELYPLNRVSPQDLWLTPLWIGVMLSILGATIFAPAYQSNQAAAWPLIVCGWPVFALGLLMIGAAWYARSGLWLYVRITFTYRHERDIRISLPLNLCIIMLRIIGPVVPALEETGLDEVLLTLQSSINHEQPLIVDMNENGKRLQVVVG